MERNSRQLEAIRESSRNVLVIAGPGSGKTEVITRKVIHDLRKGIVLPPAMALVLTFTEAAARELSRRVRKAIGDQGDRVRVHTFHGFCHSVLRHYVSVLGLGYTESFDVADVRQCDELLDACSSDLGGVRIAQSRRAVEAVKRGDVTKADAHLLALVDLYVRRMRELNLLDFSDLLLLTLRLFREHPHVLSYYSSSFDLVAVDEFQDSDPSQVELIGLLRSQNARAQFFLVADDDQVVYSWRSANPALVSEYISLTEPRVVDLAVNYRCPARIVRAASAVIAHNRVRQPKALSAARQEETECLYHAICEDEQVERLAIADVIEQFLKGGEPAHRAVVLARVGWILEGVKETLSSRGIPARLFGARPFDPESLEVRLAVGLLYSLENGLDPNLTDAVEDLYSTVGWDEERSVMAVNWVIGSTSAARKVAESSDLRTQVKVIFNTFKWVELFTIVRYTESERRRARGNLSALQTELQAKLSDGASVAGVLDDVRGQGAVHLMTIHNAKGLQYDLVAVAGLEERVLPDRRALVGKPLEEERRLFYVAITRTSQKAYLFSTLNRNGRGMQLSRFVTELPKDAVSKYTSQSIA